MSSLVNKIQPLEALENQQAAAMIPASQADQVRERAKAAETAEHPAGGCFESAQRKYNEDLFRNSWWRRQFQRFVYLPFTRFCALQLKIFPPDGFDGRCPDCGSRQREFFWVDRQGVYLDEWRALQDSARYPYGFYTWLPLDDSVESETCTTLQVFPNSPARQRYARNGHKTKHVYEQDLKRLSEVSAEAAHVSRTQRARERRSTGNGQ